MKEHWPALVIVLGAIVLLLIGEDWLATRRDQANRAEAVRQEEQKQADAFNAMITREKARLQVIEAENALKRKCMDAAKQKPIINYRENYQACLDKR